MMPDLVQSTLATIAMDDMSPRMAASRLIESLNADLGTEYSTNDLGKWRRADRPIPQPVQDWMLRVSISYTIQQCGGIPPIADEQLDRLAAMLCPPAAG